MKFKIVPIFAVIIIITAAAYYFEKQKASNNLQTFGNSDTTKIQIPEAQAQNDLNKNFSFELKTGKENYQYDYTLESAQLVDQIIVKGQVANAVVGKNFLILNLKITNNNPQGIQINTRNYIRLSADNDEWIAADIHNDPVEVQAISTKYTRLGFPVDASVKEFKLQVGEITGDKETIDLNF